MAEISSQTSVVPQGADTQKGRSVSEQKMASSQTSAAAAMQTSRGDNAVQKIERESELADNAVDVTSVTISPERLGELVEQLKASMPEQAKSLKFHVDEVLDRPVVTVVDKHSGAVIRQLPSEEVIRAVHNIDYLRGIFFDDFG